MEESLTTLLLLRVTGAVDSSLGPGDSALLAETDRNNTVKNPSWMKQHVREWTHSLPLVLLREGE